jgi:hypothetical protein
MKPDPSQWPEIKGENMEKVTAEIRVTGLKVQPFAYKDGKGEMVGGESLEMRAAGFWVDERTGDHFPASLHMTVYPGHGVVPAIGDCVKISVERGYASPVSDVVCT